MLWFKNHGFEPKRDMEMSSIALNIFCELLTEDFFVNSLDIVILELSSNGGGAEWSSHGVTAST